MRKSIFTIIIFIIIIVILVALLYFFNTIPHKQYSNSYFNIETYASGCQWGRGILAQFMYSQRTDSFHII